MRRPPSAAAPRGSSQLRRQRLLPRRGAGEARPRSFCSGDFPPLRPLSRDARPRCAGHGEQSRGLTALPARHVPQDTPEAEPPSPSKFKASPSTTSRDGNFPTSPEAHQAAAFLRSRSRRRGPKIEPQQVHTARQERCPARDPSDQLPSLAVASDRPPDS